MKFNKKFLNWSIWITLIAAYIFPYQGTDGFATHLGYPFPFLTVYNTAINTSLLKTEAINLLALAINILVIYCVINIFNALSVKAKSVKTKSIKDNNILNQNSNIMR